MRILLASSNEHKRHEIQQMFPNHEIVLPKELGIDFDCEENGTTFLENAMIKASALYEVAKDLGLPILADDSGLMVPALPGRLGVKTARFGAEDGGPLLSAHEKNQLLIKMLDGKEGKDREAFFVCALVLMFNPYRIYTAVESAEGHILKEEVNGTGGFGYDPVFHCNEAGCSMAMLPDGQKNLYSHRGKAVRAIQKFID
ncbi:MAG TPA: non-canonical purine NTP pyrophosphatase [Sphaerochaeta sp.]|nr:non-canonical purine NTP pyrophosphatase [Sphaerochaeta sp.]